MYMYFVMKQVPRLASGGGEKGMWVRESTKNDGSLAQHFRAGCNLFTVPIIQIVHSEEYIYTGVHKNIPKKQQIEK